MPCPHGQPESKNCLMCVMRKAKERMRNVPESEPGRAKGVFTDDPWKAVADRRVLPCDRCGRPFPSEGPWRRTCILCFKLDNGWQMLAGDLAFAGLQLELQRRAKAGPTPAKATPTIDTSRLDDTAIKRLLMLCHPDKHGNSELANDVTRWLLELRGRLKNAVGDAEDEESTGGEEDIPF